MRPPARPVSLVLFAVVAIVASFIMHVGFGRSVSANQPNADLEFSMHVGGCSTEGDQKGNCVLPYGSTFVVAVSLDSIPGPYGAMNVWIGYTNSASIGYKLHPHRVWPQCVVGFPYSGPDFVSFECDDGSGPVSTYTGTVVTFTFNCPTGNTSSVESTFTLVHGQLNTVLVDDNFDKFSTEAGPDVLNITCLAVPPTPTPTPTPTPPPTPTPQAVGGVALDSVVGGGNASAERLLLLVASVMVVALAGAPFVARRGLRR